MRIERRPLPTFCPAPPGLEFCSQLGGPGTAERWGRRRDLKAGTESTTVLDLLHNAHKDICWLTVSTEVEQTIDPQKSQE